MKYDATLKKMFRRPPNRLFAHALGHEVSVKRVLPTDFITVENLHPDLLFETEAGEIIHAELQGYPMAGFACRNLLYFGLVLRDYQRPPTQIVFWIGQRETGITDGLYFQPSLHYQYHVIDIRQLDADFLLDSPDVTESILAILCKLKDARATVVHILRRISELPLHEQREAVAQLLILSGLRGLMPLVKSEVQHMPVTIDLHENEFFQEIYDKGREEGRDQGRGEGRTEEARELLLEQLTAKFGPISADTKTRIDRADYATLRRWSLRLISSPALEQTLD